MSALERWRKRCRSYAPQKKRSGVQSLGVALSVTDRKRTAKSAVTELEKLVSEYAGYPAGTNGAYYCKQLHLALTWLREEMTR